MCRVKTAQAPSLDHTPTPIPTPGARPLSPKNLLEPLRLRKRGLRTEGPPLFLPLSPVECRVPPSREEGGDRQKPPLPLWHWMDLEWLPGCHGDLKGGAGAKLHNLIYARWGRKQTDIRRTFLLEGEVWSFLSAF